jgi:hypothetical protein
MTSPPDAELTGVARVMGCGHGKTDYRDSGCTASALGGRPRQTGMWIGRRRKFLGIMCLDWFTSALIV